MRVIAAGLMLAGTLAAQTPPPAPPQPAEVAIIVTPAAPNTFLMAKSGRLVGALCDDKILRLWSLPDNKLQKEIDVGGRSLDIVVISDDGAWIAAGDHNGAYSVWNAATGAEQMHVQLPFYPSAIAFSPDAKRLAIAPVGEPVQIYDPASGKKLFDLQRSIGGSEAVVFSRDRELIATADADTAVRVYDGRSGAMLDHNTDFLLEPFTAAFTPDGKQLLAAGADKVIAVLDIATGYVISKSAKTVDPIAMMDVSPDGTLVFAALMHADNMGMPAPVLISETATGKQVQEWDPPVTPIGGGWTADGHLLAATASHTALHVWRVR
jgi:WD40 repeat protein